MFIQVRLLKGYNKLLLYEVPATWPQQSLVGSLVRVPLRNQNVEALVVEELAEKPSEATYAVKPAQQLEPFPADCYYLPFLMQLSSYYQVDHLEFVQRTNQFLTQKELKRAPREEMHEQLHPASPRKEVLLTDEQQAVCDFLTPHIITPTYTPTVLHGVTGSGKTEVYKYLITQAIAQGKTVVLLLPEVTLALQFERIMRAQLPEHITICGFHSGTGPKEKRALWKNLVGGMPQLIIGVHLPILLPIANLGLIIIDEEHETGYQEKTHPKINSKDAAIMRARLNNIPILCGSATPSLSSLYNVKTKGWHFFQMKRRFAGAFPKVSTVLLADKKFRRNFWISQALENAIRDRLRKKEQVILFLNRRGFSFFVQCKTCTYIFECPHCSVSLTLHEDQNIICHYCGYSKPMPTVCTSCKAPEKELLKKGIGTQQLVTIVQKIFPTARIGRADMDISVKKKMLHETLTQFDAGDIDILIGTQTITKGFHFPNVTLVGIIWADLNLNFPVYNASETTLQQLIQVAGRAGRQRPESEVIVQAMSDHPIFSYLNEIDYLSFYRFESEQRKELEYPPYGRFAEIEFKYRFEETVAKEALLVAQHLQKISLQRGYEVMILGPAKPPVAKIKETHMRKIYMKGQNINHILALYNALADASLKSSMFFTPNPLN